MITCYLNGCSHIEGVGELTSLEELDPSFNHKEHTYLALLARKIYPNCKIINVAKPGGSNERIFRTTAQHIFDNKYDKIFIAWTHLYRLEVCKTNNDDWVALNGGLIEKVMHKEEFNGIYKEECKGIHRLMTDNKKQLTYLALYKNVLKELCKYYNIELHMHDSMKFWEWGKRLAHKADSTGHFGAIAHQKYADILYES